MKLLDTIAWILLVIGGLNWGLIGLFQFNVIDKLFMAGSTVGMIIYVLVGLSAIYAIFRRCSCCKDKCKM